MPPGQIVKALIGAVLHPLRPRPDQFLRSCQRIVHVGANGGQERDLYNYYGLAVVWVEAIPAVFEHLLQNIHQFPKQSAIRALLADRPGNLIKFNIANNSGASSSMFELALHKDIWPEVDYVDQIELETETLDALLLYHHVDLAEIDAIVLDTQGSELLVLKGSQHLLRHISYVKVEAADFEAYKGGATVASIEQFLMGFSLRLVQKHEFARHPTGGGYYDLLFKRSPFQHNNRPITRMNRILKAGVRQFVGDRNLGAIDYYRNPRRGVAWGGPFNGQACRRLLFEAIVASVQPRALVETGTYLGTTTEFLAKFGKPVFTVEGNSRAHGFARARLRKRRNVTSVYDDSRAALRRWCDGPLRSFVDGTLLFYLDAHWNDDLPLAEELDIIFNFCGAAVVMIDDFQVPFDTEYGYDDYGAGKILNFHYIAPAVSAYGLTALYPATPACEDSGNRRGCVVLAREIVHGAALRSLSLLRPAGNVPANARA